MRSSSLGGFNGLYLYVGRFLEQRYWLSSPRTQLAAAQYAQLEGRAAGLQITFSAVFILVAMLFLAAAVAIGINFAAQLADPISHLVGTAEKVGAGDLSARVPERRKTTKWFCSAAPSTA